MTLLRSTSELLLATCVVACATDTHYTTTFAPNFSPAHHAVSVLGVYRDGQMSSETWGELGPRISPALGGGSCEAGFGGSGLATNEALSSAIADAVRANGPTDELLAQLAPAAQGDLIAVFVIAGRPPVHPKSSVADEASGGGGGSLGGGSLGGGRGGPYNPGRARPHASRDPSVLQLSASLFSVAQKQSMGLIDMQYSGENAGEAMGGFVDKVRQSLAGSTCGGWNWSSVSPEQVRKLIEQ